MSPVSAAYFNTSLIFCRGVATHTLQGQQHTLPQKAQHVGIAHIQTANFDTFSYNSRMSYHVLVYAGHGSGGALGSVGHVACAARLPSVCTM